MQIRYVFLYILCAELSCKEPLGTPIDSRLVPTTDSTFSKFINQLYKNNGEMSMVDNHNDCFRMFLWQFQGLKFTIIRIEKDSMDNIKLTAKEILETRNPKTDTLVKTVNLKLTIADWDSLIELSNQAYFWTLDETEYPPTRDAHHGPTWFIEANRTPNVVTKLYVPFKTYTSVLRRRPYRGSFYKLGQRIVLLSGLMNAQELQ